MKIAICIVATCGAVGIAGLIALANEIGRFCEDTNPYQAIPTESVPRDCNGCMGAAWGDCDRCREHKE